MSNFTYICPVGATLTHADKQIDEQRKRKSLVLFAA